MMEWSSENNKNSKKGYWRGACFPGMRNYYEATIKHWDKRIG